MGPGVHGLGKSDVQPLRLAEAVLSASGRLRAVVSGADRNDRVEELRAQERQSPVRRLHGALWLRADGRLADLRIAAGLCRDRADGFIWSAGRIAARARTGFDADRQK